MRQYSRKLLITTRSDCAQGGFASQNAYFSVTISCYSLDFNNLQPHKILLKNMHLLYANVRIRNFVGFTFKYLMLCMMGFLCFVNLIFGIYRYKCIKVIWKYKCLNLLNAYFHSAPEADFCKNPVLPHNRQESGIYAILSEHKSVLSC